MPEKNMQIELIQCERYNYKGVTFVRGTVYNLPQHKARILLRSKNDTGEYYFREVRSDKGEDPYDSNAYADKDVDWGKDVVAEEEVDDTEVTKVDDDDDGVGLEDEDDDEDEGPATTETHEDLDLKAPKVLKQPPAKKKGARKPSKK